MQYFFITGTSRGLGKAIAEQLLESEDAKVTGISRGQSIHHNRYDHLHLDLSDAGSILKYRFPKLESPAKIVLINNAGTLGEIRYLGNMSDQVLTDGLQTNLVSPVVLMNKFMTAYKETPCEKIIINVSSGAATKPYDGWGMYCASKAGLKMISESTAKEQNIQAGAHPFTVLSIAPGVIQTEMQEQIRKSDQSDFSMIDKFIGLNETNALYSPEAVAQKYVEIIQNPEIIKDGVHRIEL